MRNHASLILALLVCILGASRSYAEPVREGLASNGLCGLASTAYPTCPRRIGVSATGSYGYTESLGTVPGAHHRIGGVLGIGVAPLPWLAVALRFDGRINLHPDDTRGADRTGTGDPRLFLRAGHELTEAWSLGAESVIWFPGNEAPSFKPRATTVDLKALAAWRAPSRSLSLLGHVGLRLDQSEASAPDLRRLREGDRLALGLSDSHAVLLAVGASTRAVAKSELFVEVALDWLVGNKAPPLGESPLRATVGARRFISARYQVELSGTVALQGRPSLAASAPLVPIEPRFLLAAGLRYGHDLDRAPPVAPPEPVRVAEPPTVVAPPPEPATATVTGTLGDAKDEPVPDVRVRLRHVRGENETVSDGDGTYTFADVPAGPAQLEAAAAGFETQSWDIEVRADMPPVPKHSLTTKGKLGTLRLLTRTFSSEPLATTIQVRDVRNRKVGEGQADAQGRFELDLPPGRYVVMISAKGYKPHRREIAIERYAVAILNVDMREQK